MPKLLYTYDLINQTSEYKMEVSGNPYYTFLYTSSSEIVSITYTSLVEERSFTDFATSITNTNTWCIDTQQKLQAPTANAASYKCNIKIKLDEAKFKFSSDDFFVEYEWDKSTDIVTTTDMSLEADVSWAVMDRYVKALERFVHEIYNIKAEV
jgi:hypothetical protein